MTVMQLIFLLNAAVTIIAGIMVARVHRLLHAALWLILALFGVAITYGLLEASFLAIVQVVVYIGAIAILILFAIMLTRGGADDTYNNNRRWIISIVVALIALGGILLALFTWPHTQALTTTLTPAQQDIGSIGLLLLDPEGYLIPFEISSILLLAALIGSIYVGIEHKGEEK